MKSGAWSPGEDEAAVGSENSILKQRTLRHGVFSLYVKYYFNKTTEVFLIPLK